MLPLLAANIDAVCQILIGAYMCWFAYGKLGLADPNRPAETTSDERPPWQRTILLIAGPMLVSCGLVMLLVRAPAFVGPPTWERCTSDDGTVSVRLPYRPERMEHTRADAGKVPKVVLACEPGRLPAAYTLTWAPVAEAVPPESAAEVLESLKTAYRNGGCEVVAAAVMRRDGLPAYEIELVMPDGKLRTKARIAYVGRTMYTAQAIAPDFAGQEADLARFFDSFRIERRPID